MKKVMMLLVGVSLVLSACTQTQSDSLGAGKQLQSSGQGQLSEQEQASGQLQSSEAAAQILPAQAESGGEGAAEPPRASAQTQDSAAAKPVQSAEAGGPAETEPGKEEIIRELLEKAKIAADEDRYKYMDVSESKKRKDIAAAFIRYEFPDYFSYEETLKKSIEYGYYYEQLHNEYIDVEDEGLTAYWLGKNLTDTAQAVYLGKLSPSSSEVQAVLEELSLRLQFFYGDDYGKTK